MKWRDLISEQVRSGGVWQHFAASRDCLPTVFLPFEHRTRSHPELLAHFRRNCDLALRSDF